MSSRSFFVLLLLAACSGSSTTTGASSTSGGASSSSGTSITPGAAEPVVLPDGTTVPTVSCGDESSVSAAGTWDVLQTINGNTGTAALALTDSTFSFSANPVSISFMEAGNQMSAVWTDPRDSNHAVPISVTQNSAALDLGILPLALGGSWSFSGDAPTDGCGAVLGDGSFMSTCTNVQSARLGRLDGVATGTRTSKKDSVFGSLGGVWHLTGSNGTGTIDATFSANVFTVIVTGRVGTLGSNSWATVKICNGQAAGLSSDGAEIAATRR